MPRADRGLFASPPDRPESVPDDMITLWDALIQTGTAMFRDNWENHDVFAQRNADNPNGVSAISKITSAGAWERGQQAWDQLRDWLHGGKIRAFRLPDTPIKPDAWDENRSRFILRSGKIRRLGKRPWDWVVVLMSDLDQIIEESYPVAAGTDPHADATDRPGSET